MIGAIIGDIAGSRFEHHNRKTKDFVLMSKNLRCRPTDDSVMTLAVARAILACEEDFSSLAETAIASMQAMGRRHPNAGYGRSFLNWIYADDPQPYNSFGNGAAMRVSPCGWAAKSADEAAFLARAVTAVSHDHPESLKAAETVSVFIWMARQGADREELRSFVTDGYCDLDFTLDGIRESYTFDVTCQGSVPQAFEAFFESEDFEDAVRNAVSIGGDSDTIAAIAGGLAEAFYGVPVRLREQAVPFLFDYQKDILEAFEARYGIKTEG